VGKEESDAISRVLKSGWLAEGPITKQFEQAVAEYTGAKHAVAVCNCTVALELCLRAYNVKGKVVTPAFGHPATPQAIINAGATPVFCDVSLESYNAEKTSLPLDVECYMPVSLFGYPVTSYPVRLTVEDAACSLGSEYQNVKTGKYGTLCFSFHPRKPATTGEGGVVATDSKELADKIRKLKNFGRGNYKFDDVRAAIGIEQMKKLPTILKRRAQMAKTYTELLSEVEGVKSPQAPTYGKHTFQTYAVHLKSKNRDRVIQRLFSKNIETQVGAYALHLMPRYRYVERLGHLSNSTLLHRNLLALPMSYDMTEEDQRQVVEEIGRAIQ